MGGKHWEVGMTDWSFTVYDIANIPGLDAALLSYVSAGLLLGLAAEAG